MKIFRIIGLISAGIGIFLFFLFIIGIDINRFFSGVAFSSLFVGMVFLTIGFRGEKVKDQFANYVSDFPLEKIKNFRLSQFPKKNIRIGPNPLIITFGAFIIIADLIYVLINFPEWVKTDLIGGFWQGVLTAFLVPLIIILGCLIIRHQLRKGGR